MNDTRQKVPAFCTCVCLQKSWKRYQLEYFWEMFWMLVMNVLSWMDFWGSLIHTHTHTHPSTMYYAILEEKTEKVREWVYMCERERQRYTGSLPNMPSLWNAQFGQNIIFIPSNTNSFFLAKIFKIIAPSLLVFILKTCSTVTSYSHPTALQTEQKTCFSCLTWHPFINLSSAPEPLALSNLWDTQFLHLFLWAQFI